MVGPRRPRLNTAQRSDETRSSSRPLEHQLVQRRRHRHPSSWVSTPSTGRPPRISPACCRSPTWPADYSCLPLRVAPAGSARRRTAGNRSVGTRPADVWDGQVALFLQLAHPCFESSPRHRAQRRLWLAAPPAGLDVRRRPSARQLALRQLSGGGMIKLDRPGAERARVRSPRARRSGATSAVSQTRSPSPEPTPGAPLSRSDRESPRGPHRPVRTRDRVLQPTPGCRRLTALHPVGAPKNRPSLAAHSRNPCRRSRNPLWPTPSPIYGAQLQ